jgi:hypothetical protein
MVLSDVNINNTYIREVQMKKIFLSVIMVVFVFASMAIAASADDYFKFGNAVYKKGDYNKAMVYYKYAAKMEPRNPTYSYAIAACYEKTGNTAMAAKYRNYAKSLPANGQNNVQTASPAPSGVSDTKLKNTIFFGFTSVAMQKVNAELDSMAAAATLMGTTPEKVNTGGAFFLGAQSGYRIINGLYAGPRVEYIGGAYGKVAYTETYFGVSDTLTTEFSMSMIDLAVGASYSFPLSIPLDLSAGLYLGFGSAAMSWKQTDASGGTSVSQTLDFDGGAFLTVLNVNCNYKISKSLSAGLSVGYRLANVSQMALSNDYSYNGTVVLKKGYVLTDSDNKPMPFDFSGLLISVGMTYSF